MDTQALVAGGADGLSAIAKAFRDDGFPVEAVYLIKLTSDEGNVKYVVRLVTTRSTRETIYKHVEMRRSGKLPMLDARVRVDAIQPDNAEAVRVLKYASLFDRMPVEIDGVMIDGMLIDYALVAESPRSGIAAA